MRFIGGKDGVVFVIDEQAECLGRFAWGDTSPGASDLARAVLLRSLEDLGRAERLYRRYLHRVVKMLPKGREWTLSDSEVKTVVGEIETVEKEMRADVQRMSREPMRGMMRAGNIVDDSEWTKTPDIRRNDPWAEGKLK